MIVAIVVPLNVVFGLVTALALARGRFPGKGILQAVVDLPFAVSPVIVGVALILFWGNDGWLGGAFPVIFSLPGHGARDRVRHAAVRRARGRAGAARDRHRAGGGRLDARRLALADVLADHAPGDPGRRGLRRRADRRPLAGRVRRADRRRRRRGRRVPDAHPARPRPLHRRPQHLRRLLGGDRADGPRARDPRPDDPAREEATHDHRLERVQALRRLHRPRRRLARGPRRLADRAARAVRLRQVDAAADHRRARVRRRRHRRPSTARTSPASRRRSAASASSSSTTPRSST